MRGKITKTSVDALAPTDKGEEQTLWDTELKGFGVRVRPGGVKTYVLHYRAGTGRGAELRKFTIGRHGSPWTPEKARREADRLLGLVKTGHDPAADKIADRASMTVSELCDLYLKEGCATKKPATLATDRGRILRHIKPLLGKKKAKDVTRADVERFLQDVASGKTAADEKTVKRGRAIVEGGRGTATRTVGLLGGIFTFAVDRKICQANPVRGVKRFKDKKCNRYLSPAEVERLGRGMAIMEEVGVLPPLMGAAIRLLALTGCRKGEVLSLKWSYVDAARGYLRLPDSKTGAKAVPLGAPALELLQGLPRISEWVFPAATGKGFLVGLQHAWEGVRVWCDLEDVRLHDLRHSFASFGAMGGDSLLIIGTLLGHRDPKSTSRYAHVADDFLRGAADRVSSKVAAHLSGREPAAVIPMRSVRHWSASAGTAACARFPA